MQDVGGESGAIVRSNKGVAVALLFRHSIMAVVEKGGVSPPYLMQW